MSRTTRNLNLLLVVARWAEPVRNALASSIEFIHRDRQSDAGFFRRRFWLNCDCVQRLCRERKLRSVCFCCFDGVDNRGFVFAELISAVLLILAFSSLADGQTATPPSVGPVGDNVQRPIPGIGHDYIHMLSETVNPGNGTLSIRIEFPVPKGRGITPPAVATYNSGELNSLLDNNGTYVWSTAPGSLPGLTSGWGTGSGTPLTGASSVWNFTSPAPPESPYSEIDCNFASGFSFTDLNGTQHTLPVGAAILPTTAPTNAVCSGSVVNAPESDTQMTAVLTTPLTGASAQLASGGQFPVYVIDKEGNTYSFQSASLGGVGQTNYGGMEDRNGNLLTGEDTAGRPIALGFGAQAGTYSIYGLSYTVATKATTVSYAPAAASSILTGHLSPVCPSLAPLSPNSATMTVIHTIMLPNGQSYQFFYGDDNPDTNLNNPYGLISEIIYPNGGWVKYHWQLAVIPVGQPNAGNPLYTQVSSYAGTSQGASVSNLCSVELQTPVVSERDVSFDGNSTQQTQTFVYNTTWNGGAWTSKAAQVTTTDNVLSKSFVTAYTYMPVSSSTATPYSTGCGACASPMEQTVQRYDWGNPPVPLDTATKAWYNQFELACEFHTLATGQTSGHFYQYSYGQISDDKEYDFGQITNPASFCAGINPAPPSVVPARETITAFQSFISPVTQFITPLTPPNLYFYKPSTVITYAPGTSCLPGPGCLPGTEIAETDYSYDTNPLASVTAVNHDSNFGIATTVRGNVTKITRRCLTQTSPSGCSQDSITQFTYDITGQPATMTDPNGNVTTYSFSDVSDTTADANAAGNSNAYLTSVTYPKTNVVHTESFQYNYATQSGNLQSDLLPGELMVASDENAQTTNYTYYTLGLGIGMLETIQGPADSNNGGQRPTSSYTYNLPTNWMACQAINTTQQKKCVTSVLDGMWRVTQTQTTNPSNTSKSLDYVDTTYDAESRVNTVSNPYWTTTDQSYGVTTFSYDTLGRKTKQLQSDSASIQCGVTMG